MKRLIPASILFIAVIASYFFSLRYINATCDDTQKLVLHCEEEYRNGSDASSTAKELSEMWDEKEKVLSFFVNHNQIDEIELEISSLSVFCNSENEIYFYDSIETLKTLLHQVKEDTKMSTHSIF